MENQETVQPAGSEKTEKADKKVKGKEKLEEVEVEAKSEGSAHTDSDTDKDKAKTEKAEVKEEPNYKDKFYYLAAEMENTKRRFEREKESLLKYGSEKILKDMVDVIDDLERTMNAIENDKDEKVKNIFVGIEMVKNKFLDVLSKSGLKQLEAKGKQFDPTFHEALMQQDVEKGKDGEILQEYQKGYTLYERLLRPAKVVVAKVTGKKETK